MTARKKTCIKDSLFALNDFSGYSAGRFSRGAKQLLAEDNDIEGPSRGFRLAIRRSWNAGQHAVDAPRVDGAICEQRGIPEMTFEERLSLSNETNVYEVLPRDRAD